MPPFRMPFTSKRPTAPIETNDENARPNSFDGNIKSPYSKDKPSLALGIKEKTVEPNEFKLSSVNDSGEYLPPSPTEKQSFWSAKSPSSANTNHRQCFNDNEAFTISRESFESYRRSFDISGRSPILQTDSFNSRTSLDSRPATRFPTRSTLSSTTFERPTTAEDPIFEDVKLNEEAGKPQESKKKSFLSRFGDSNGENVTANAASKEEGKHHFHFLPGRKRGQSGTGNELGDIPRPQSRGNANAEVTVR
ncbi:uncharacterized protein Z520_08769 [Fonsecaea multimorphosa CBS 102226]|uniref:Uncharacterized protein n=1 Tax=Fonsecaea multimorphosa CBS 102226 TaxID=1442371 RepID=A0A0D2JYJ5_9EURO|nr:uncharacterized protein Z520_08769 [Fonsecaea multimorphosa CBS 102226]KIX95649.1 hypothetical protein Z520_08769 [Fonsecaea multimorphosa CBS 102226]OAL21250.1 hypothetical protein AYO22_08213 [Fonsecaea multimorphosa]